MVYVNFRWDLGICVGSFLFRRICYFDFFMFSRRRKGRFRDRIMFDLFYILKSYGEKNCFYIFWSREESGRLWERLGMERISLGNKV